MSNLESDEYAFPGTRYSRSGVNIGHGQGMTLRDWFAGHALNGLAQRRWEDNDGNIPADIFETWAESAYRVADAMIDARNKTT